MAGEKGDERRGAGRSHRRRGLLGVGIAGIAAAAGAIAAILKMRRRATDRARDLASRIVWKKPLPARRVARRLYQESLRTVEVQDGVAIVPPVIELHANPIDLTQFDGDRPTLEDNVRQRIEEHALALGWEVEQQFSVVIVDDESRPLRRPSAVRPPERDSGRS